MNSFFSSIWTLIARIFIAIFGTFSWRFPIWLTVLFGFVLRFKKTVIALSAVFIIGVAGLNYWQSLPQPLQLVASLSSIGITDDFENAIPDPLRLTFAYDYSNTSEKSRRQLQRVDGRVSIARIDLLDTILQEDLVSISPTISGEWRWQDEATLIFTPQEDWPADREYEVRISKALVSEQANLGETRYSFSTPSFKASLESPEFYQDPQDVSIRRVIATMRFSHPVDPATLKEKISLSLIPDTETSQLYKENFTFTLTYSDSFRQAYIQSEPVTLPERASYMAVDVAPGIRTTLGAAKTNRNTREKVFIPDLYSFLKIDDADVSIVRDEKNNPQQVVTLAFTDDISLSQLKEKLSIYLLPEKIPNIRNYSITNIPESYLTSKAKVDIGIIPNPRNSSKNYGIVIDEPENRRLYIRIDKGLTSVNNYTKRDVFSKIVSAPRYPKEADIYGEGAILTSSGERKISVASRGVSALRYSVGKLDKSQIYHLISQTNGDISNPEFRNWNFGYENLMSSSRTIVPLNTKDKKTQNFSSFDLSGFINEGEQHGIFHIGITGWDIDRKRQVSQAADSRLVLITDLGMIVKQQQDGSRKIFVQSISTGRPVANATVQMVAKNGSVLAESQTDDQGHTDMLASKGFNNENTPTVFVAKTETDFSFIPVNRYSRQINLSRFNIGGQTISSRDNKLSAFVFTDRGIYRPGETANMAAIIKNYDFSPISKLPLEAVVMGPRSEIVGTAKSEYTNNGIDDYDLPLPKNTPTGIYTINLHTLNSKGRRDRRIGSTRFSVEEFQPDTLKIETKLVGAPRKGWVTDAKIKAEVSLQNLFGSPAQDRRVNATVQIFPTAFSFSEYSGYQFGYVGDNAEDLLNIYKTLDDQQTSSSGKASFDIDLSEIKEASYGLRVTTRGFDQGGGRSVSTVNMSFVAPFDYLVGYKADGDLGFINQDAKRAIHFIAVDNTELAVSKNNLLLKIIEKQNISTLVKKPNGTYAYQTVERELERSSSAFAIDAATTKFALDTSTPGDFILQVIEEDQRILSSFEYSVVGFDDLSGRLDKNAELSVKLNKADYKPGETIALNITAPYSGSGLITIESDKVHAFKWFTSTTQSSMQKITVPEGIEGSAYINVAFVRDANAKEIFTSPLSYAVVPFSLDKSKRTIDITLDVPKIARPGKPMKISYKSSKPSKMIVYAVNEGILQVAKYQTPDPLAHFLRKRALSVSTMQMLDLILPDFNLVKALSAPGGGFADEMSAMKMRRESAVNLNAFERKTDKPAVFWSEVVDGFVGFNDLTFNVPDTFSGELRVMAVAVTDDALGAAQASTIVRGPFVVSPNLVTHAAPGDIFDMTVGVANLIDGASKDSLVTLRAKASEHLEIISAASFDQKIGEGDEGVYTFRVKALEKFGSASIAFTAALGDIDSTRTTTLSIRPATHLHTTLQASYNKGKTLTITPPRKLYAALSEQRLSLSKGPLVLLQDLDYFLQAYPHQCTEQVVSRVFPSVALGSSPAFADVLSESNATFEDAIKILVARQQSDGGFAFWNWGSQSEIYPTLYAMHFLIEANDLGLPVPARVFSYGMGYLDNFVRQSDGDHTYLRHRAMAIYLLTRNGTITTNFLADLDDTIKTKHARSMKRDITRVFMAATYQLLQKQTEAEKLIRDYELNFQSHTGFSDFHNLLAHDSQYLTLLAKHFPKRVDSLSPKVMLDLTDHIGRGDYNTLSASYAIQAIAAISKAKVGSVADKDFEIAVRKASQEFEEATINTSPFTGVLYSSDVIALKAASSKKGFYYVNRQSGFDSAVPENAIKSGMEVFREYKNANGDVVTQAKQGDELSVKIRIRSIDKAFISNVALVDLLPAGFEIVRESLPRRQRAFQRGYADIREDRVVYYLDVTRSIGEINYKVKATASGEFVLPAVYAQSMYDNRLHANSKAARLKISKN